MKRCNFIQWCLGFLGVGTAGVPEVKEEKASIKVENLRKQMYGEQVKIIRDVLIKYRKQKKKIGANLLKVIQKN